MDSNMPYSITINGRCFDVVLEFSVDEHLNDNGTALVVTGWWISSVSGFTIPEEVSDFLRQHLNAEDVENDILEYIQED